MVDQDRADPERDIPPSPGLLDRILSFFEGVTAIIVTIPICFSILFVIYWIVVGADEKTTVNGIHDRLVQAFSEAHKNWKAGLLLLIPLFYRPARMFLLLVEEAWGVKTGPRTPGQRETRPNPPEMP